MTTVAGLLALFSVMPACGAVLSQDERDRAMSELHATRKQFLDAVAGLTSAQWHYRTAPGVWTLAEIAEPLAVTEDWIFDNVTKKILATPAEPGNGARTRGRDEQVLKIIADRSSKRQAPAGIAPAQRFATPQAAVEHFRAARDRTIAYLRTTRDDLRAHTSEHRAAGLIDAYQSFLVAAAHTTRHLEQMAEVKAAPGYPALSGAPR
jgi:hypothetical protein